MTAQARSAWPVSASRVALNVIAAPDRVSAFLIDRNDDCTSIHAPSNSMRLREKLCCAFMTIWALASMEYSIFVRPRTPSRCRHW